MNTRKFRLRIPVHALTGISIALLAMPALADTNEELQILRQQLEEQRAKSIILEQRINELASASAKAKAPETVSSVTAGYDEGFYVKDASGNHSLRINGLLQPRYTYFKTSDVQQLGGTESDTSSFDIFLGRLYFSGSVADPSIGYWFTLQGGTSDGMTLLDAELSKTFSPYLTVEMGKYWSAYTYQYYVDIGQYLLPDLSLAEWSFSLGRQTGVRASGKAGKLAYSVSLSNSIAGSDIGNSTNLHTDLATIVNLNYDILDPYGYKETDTTPGGPSRPQLSLWVSGMYNPVEYTSKWANDDAGEKTYGMTASLNYRYRNFGGQLSAYWKNNQPNGNTSDYDSYGWGEQAGYYIVPGKVELAQRVSHVKWGAPQDFNTGGGRESNWYAGPTGFAWEKLTEYTVGVNYYLKGNHAKVMAAYTRYDGEGFTGTGFEADRFTLQTQIAF